MHDDLIRKFTCVSLKYRKVDICAMTKGDTHFTELTLMKSIVHSCPGSCGNLNVSSMREQLHLSQSAVSQALKSLEKKGYVTRDIDPHDRRKISVAVTESGCRAVEESERCYKDAMNYVISRFGEDNLMQLTELLEQLISIYEEMDKRE